MAQPREWARDDQGGLARHQNKRESDLTDSASSDGLRLTLSEEMARAAIAIAWVRQGHALPEDIATVRGIHGGEHDHESADWPQRSRAAVRDMIFSTIRQMGLGEVLLSRLNRRRPDDAVLALQLVALEQLLNPLRDVHTIVDQAVEAARARPATRGATTLINAVLRGFLRDQARQLELARQDPVAQYNFPRWWINTLQRDYPDRWQQVLTVSNQPAPLTLRINLRRSAVSDYLDRLRREGIAATQVGDEAVMLHKATDVHLIPGFDAGHVSVQDAGAQLATHLLDVRDRMRVLDACAAPGGKTAHLLEAHDIELVALDKDERRMRRVSDNLQRLGLVERATLKAGDAQRPELWFDGRQFDRVLVDAPCTASGIVRRHPESRWLRQRRDIETFAAQQSQIVSGLWPTVKPGGKLLYATCSVFKDEGEGVMDRFVSQNGSARRLPLSEPGKGRHTDPPGPWFDSGSAGQLLPVAGPDCDHDGFYYALVEKKLT